MHRILVVDDDLDNVVLAKTVLERAGFEVVATVDPAAAPALADEGDFDAFVLDLMMPGLSGLDLLKVLRGNPRTRSLPILFLSSHAQASDRVRGLREGADDYLGKPFDPAELILRIQRLVASAAAPSESLEGKLEDFPLSEVVQTLQQGRQSGSLAVVGSEGVGRLVLRNGEIVEVSFARLAGADALQAMLDQQRGRFRFNRHESSGRDLSGGNDAVDLQSTLLEAAWIDDELALRRRYLPGMEEPLMAAARSEPAAPPYLPVLPIQAIYHRVQTLPGLTLGDLMANQWTAPNRLRLAAAWLVECGALRVAERPPGTPASAGAGQPASGDEAGWPRVAA
jgi:DNA-binding response OmpR family regulator